MRLLVLSAIALVVLAFSCDAVRGNGGGAIRTNWSGGVSNGLSTVPTPAAPACPDGACNGTEDCNTCAADCAADALLDAYCDDGTGGRPDCSETCDNAPSGCGVCCGNGICEDGTLGNPDYGETHGNCPDDCDAAVCGNGALEGAEVCDDGNTSSSDGCNATCTTVESGWTCPTPGAACVPICGDGLLKGSEACDDSNTSNGDGCNSTCTAVESGYHCLVVGSPCVLDCGNGTCDDGVNGHNNWGEGCECATDCGPQNEISLPLQWYAPRCDNASWANNDPMTSLNDYGSNNYDLANGTGSPVFKDPCRTSYINGYACATFDDTDDYFQTTSGTQAATWTVCGVSRENTAFTDGRYDTIFDSDSGFLTNQTALWYRYSGGSSLMHSESNAGASAVTLTEAGLHQEYHSWCIKHHAPTGAPVLDVDGYTQATGGISSGSAFNGFRIGRDRGSLTDYLSGDVVEIALFGSAITYSSWHSYAEGMYGSMPQD